MEIEEKLNILFWRAEYYGAFKNLGTASVFMGLAGATTEMGWPTTFVSSGPMDLPESVDYHLIKHNRHLWNFPEVLNFPYNFKSSKEVVKIVKEKEIDILFQYHHDFLFGSALVNKETGIPNFIHCDGVQYWIRKNWGKLYFERFLRYAEEIQWEQADRIFVVSEGIKNQIVEHGVDSSKIIISPNGVNTNIFKKNDSKKLKKELGIEDSFVCGFAGSFGHWHGVDTIAQSIKHVVKLIPNVKFLLIGDGELRPKIEEIVKNDNTDKNIIITGLIPFKRIPDYLSACDILLTPCKSNDDGSDLFNSPIKLFEYMSMGIPTIASNVGQQGNVLKQGKLGSLIPERDVFALAESIKNVFDNYEYFLSLANDARTEVENNYDWKSNIQRIYREYKRIRG